MTQDAQGALRRIMETYAKITRFCLVCNYVTRWVYFHSCILMLHEDDRVDRIIEPLASRCSKFRFTPLDSTSTSNRLSHIATAEHIPLDHSVISTLISTSQGDLRRSITYLQSASRLSSSINPPVPITARDIQEIAGVLPDAVVVDFATTLGIEPIGGDIDIEMNGTNKVKGFDGVRKKVKELMREGYSASQILLQASSLLDFVNDWWHYNFTAPRPDYTASHRHSPSEGSMRPCPCRSGQGPLRRCRWRVVDPRSGSASLQGRILISCHYSWCQPSCH